MVHAKNYETMSTFVKVMQKKLWPLFFRTRCTLSHKTVFITLWMCCSMLYEACQWEENYVNDYKKKLCYL